MRSRPGSQTVMTFELLILLTFLLIMQHRKAMRKLVVNIFEFSIGMRFEDMLRVCKWIRGLKR